MCILVYKPAGVKLPAKNIIQNCYKNNPDGCGMMWVENNEVKIDKGLYDFETFYSKLLEHEDKNLIFHCRIKTHGEIKAENCHPFKITEEFALAHNGILHVQCYQGMTDSESFGIDYMGHLTREDLFNEKIQKILNEIVVANSSKVAVMTNKDEVILFNPKGFIEENGVFFSNGTFRYCYEYYSAQTYAQKQKLKSGTEVVENVNDSETYQDSSLPEKLDNETHLEYIARCYENYNWQNYNDDLYYGSGYYYNGKYYKY